MYEEKIQALLEAVEKVRQDYAGVILVEKVLDVLEEAVKASDMLTLLDAYELLLKVVERSKRPE